MAPAAGKRKKAKPAKALRAQARPAKPKPAKPARAALGAPDPSRFRGHGSRDPRVLTRLLREAGRPEPDGVTAMAQRPSTYVGYLEEGGAIPEAWV